MAYVMLSGIQNIGQLYLRSFAPQWLKVWPDALKEAKKIRENSLASPANLAKNPWNVDDPSTLKIVSLNVRSLSGYILDLRADPTILKGDIICLQEINHSPQAKPFLTDQYTYTHVFEGKGKGVAMFVRNSLVRRAVGPPIGRKIEFAWCIKLSFTDLDVLTVYRSPNEQYKSKTHYQTFVEMINSLLGPSNSKPTVICGDFNFNYWEQPNNPVRVMLGKRGFTQIVTMPTNIYGSCLDHVYVKGIENRHHLHYPYYTDHEAVCVRLKYNVTQ